MKNLWEFCKREGAWGIWNEIVKALDPQGKKNAFKILGLREGASQGEIASVYRKLALKWHPDKHFGLENKQMAQAKFMEIQEAMALLSKTRKNRLLKGNQI